MRQESLFSELGEQPPRVLPVLSEQRDIQYLGVTAKSILNGPATTGMGFWSLNPYVGCAFGCAYCYARYAHRYVMERAAAQEGAPVDPEFLTLPPWLAFERRIVVKQNAAHVLRKTLRHGGERHLALASGDTLVIGTATDPYQPAERRYRLTRGVLEVLAEHEKLSIVIITKSPLITRDIDLLLRVLRHSRLMVHVSLITLDRTLARRIEPRAATPEARLRALARLRDAGIEAGINCIPVLPGITDNPASLDALVEKAAACGAMFVNAGSLRLQSTARQRYLPFIEQEFPHLAARYRATYSRGPDMGARYRNGLRAFFKRTCARHGLSNRSRDYDDEEMEDGESETGPVTPEQLAFEL